MVSVLLDHGGPAEDDRRSIGSASVCTTCTTASLARRVAELHVDFAEKLAGTMHEETDGKDILAEEYEEEQGGSNGQEGGSNAPSQGSAQQRNSDSRTLEIAGPHSSSAGEEPTQHAASMNVSCMPVRTVAGLVQMLSQWMV